MTQFTNAYIYIYKYTCVIYMCVSIYLRVENICNSIKISDWTSFLWAEVTKRQLWIGLCIGLVVNRGRD